MKTQENTSGKPLADAEWLEHHHNAKMPERVAFAKRLALLRPKSIVDLGCATGLWLELLNDHLPDDCEFVGIDSDEVSLEVAKKKSYSWKRKSSFIVLDLEKEASKIPPSDLTLAFNIFPYISDLKSFLDVLSSRRPKGALAIRQYDGASIRFGPMITSERQQMEVDLRLAVDNSQEFKHYDLDRAFQTINNSAYKTIDCWFELFQRVSPFSKDFIPYYKGTLEWTYNHLSARSAERLKAWMANSQSTKRYFFEVDLVAILS